MAGIFYGVGVGPGDPELLTLKAKRILEEADVLAVPVKKPGQKSAAYEIIKEVVDMEGKELLESVFYMASDPDIWYACAKEAGEAIAGYLGRGKNVVLITLGDVTVFSTCMYVQQYIAARGFETVLVPGISSYSAGAARAGIPLAEGKESLAVVPAIKKTEDLKVILDTFDNIVLMKAGKSITWLSRYMDQAGISAEQAVVLSCVGMESEYIGPLDEEREYGYFTTVIIRKKKG